MKEQSIINIDTKSIHKASIVERFNRTLKEKMFRYFTQTKKQKYINVLAQLVENYNNSYHRTIKMKPCQVTEKNEKKVFNTLYGEDEDYIVKYNLNIGDYVREVVDKKVFEKGYTPNWSKEIYLVHARFPSKPPTYQIKTLDGKEFEWKYYQQELQKVYWPYDTFEIVDKSDPNYFKARQLNTPDEKITLIKK